jgi:peptide chain release factor 2
VLIDDLREQLKALEPDISIITTYWNNSGNTALIEQLEEKSNDPNSWQDPKQAHVLKELQGLKTLADQYSEVTGSCTEMSEMLELFKDDEAELQKLAGDIKKLSGLVRSFKLQVLLSGEQDSSNCFLSINAGAGGTESQDWASMLLRMYTRFCEKNGLQVGIVDYQDGEEAGIKSATLFIKGKRAYGLIKSEHGTHRLVRISPYDSNKRRHTSFAGVFVTPEVPKVGITIDPTDLRIDTYRASGAGGQHVNKTDSAVRITHGPSKIVVQCQNERSQLQNKETAMKMLKAKLAQKQEEEAAAKSAAVVKKKIEWGSQIRSYVLHPYKMVKDHRTSCESSQPDLVLDGDLIDFIESYLVQK